MNDDYLWDRSGRDPEVERLELLLRPLALDDRRVPPLPGAAPRRPRPWPILLAVATLAASVVVAVTAARAQPATPGYRVTAEERRFTCAPGSWVGGAGCQRRIAIGDIGTVTADPDAEVMVVSVSDQLHKLRLERGAIEATISANARPGLFQVETPATTCVDLGCRYTLAVDGSGRAQVRVTTGRVAFVGDGRDVYIPAGAHCSATPARGIGAPVWDDAGDGLGDAVAAFDRATGPERIPAARLVGERAGRGKDVLTLWHLFNDRDRAVAGTALDALIRLQPPPPGTPREALAAREPVALRRWRSELALLADLGPEEPGQ